MRFPWQAPQGTLTAFTDSDWAGCPVTARSTSGGIIAIGDHVIKTYSRQQKVIALSSAEAELYAMVAASAESLAVISYSRDLGHTMVGEIYTDSAAALGISQRAGIGKVRHLRTQGLWVQEVRVSGRLAYHKVLGTKNPSDVLTKHVPGELLERHIETMGMESRGGRAESAPELNSVESLVTSWTGPLNGEEDDTADCKRVRFDRRVQFRAVPHANRGRKCRECRIPGGVRRRKSVMPRHATDRPGATPAGVPGGVGHQKGTTTDRAGTASPRWADVVDNEGISAVSVFHGSEARGSSAADAESITMVSEHSGFEGVGSLWTNGKQLTGVSGRGTRTHATHTLYPGHGGTIT